MLAGVMRCEGCCADVTTKDLSAGRSLCVEPPCVGERSLSNLIRSWRQVCCGPVRLKQAAGDKLLQDGHAQV